ncbi:patatin-like phospholipase family protein [Paucibacter sp. B2R-40]|uniref:patatin-like phospholipase family protein n=1 Tax=Paucibacter sp. B2R-40 TaxID=2893554 RepID=UPI0021E427F4|nr:patatin-like phospholipase family protein [Paucibacter sp. B2R-40]MCV2355227.1 patatin-like phospholipase family protein [Paucibacter sp. B2R-40]
MLISFFCSSRQARSGTLLLILSLSLLITACSHAPLVPPEKAVTIVPEVTGRSTLPAPLPAPVPPRLGLALGGGGARGFAHIGVIQVLEEQGIKVDLLAGTSAGSLVAALYASGLSGREMALLAENMDEGVITDWAFPTRGLIRGEALARFVREKTGAKQIEQMKLPLGIVATDASDGSGILFRRGDTGTAVRASSSVPAVFQPVRIGGRDYVDGGLVAPVPVSYARKMGAEVVIAVDITSPPEEKPGGNAISMSAQSVSIMMRSINNYELREADIVLRPKLDGIGSADFTARKRSVQAGREAALVALPQIRAKIAAKTH